MIGFGKFGKKWSTENSEQNSIITSTDDARLVYIDPTSEEFFEGVLGCDTENDNIKKFIEAIQEVKEVGVKPFWKPIYDPSIDGRDIVFVRGNIPAVGYPFFFWKEETKHMPAVEEKKWAIGTEYQYYAFLVWLANGLVQQNGWEVEEALYAIVNSSKELGHYYDAVSSKDDFEDTGSREVCGVYDLGNTYKMLSCTNEGIRGYWRAGGCYDKFSDEYSLAAIYHFMYYANGDFDKSVGWLVLS